MGNKLQSLTLAQHRLQQLAAVSQPLWKLNLALHLAAMLRSIVNGHREWEKSLAETSIQLAYVAFCLGLAALPVSAVHSGRLNLLQPACVVLHLIRSLLVLSSGLWMTPNVGGAVCLRLRVELVLEIALAIQDQMSLPIMAILHALRQVAWMSVLVVRMHGDPYHAVMRGLLNWVVMLVLSWVFETRTRALYCKLCSTQQQRQQDKQPALPRPVPSLPLIEGASEFTSHLPEPVKPPKGEGSSANQASTKQPAGALAATKQHIPVAARSGGRGGVGGPRAPTRSLPSSQEALSSIMQVIQQQKKMTSTYTRNTTRFQQTVHVKIKGVELDDLPPDMPSIMEQQLQRSMPGMVMSGLAFRNGCVMMTVDLMDLMAQPTLALASSMMDLVTRVMRDNTMGQLLSTGAAMCIQTPDQVVVCQWDADSSSYAVATTPAGQLGPDHSCRLVSATPAVHTLPDSSQATVAGADRAAPRVGVEEASGDDGRLLTFTVELQLPRDCRLDGWQLSGDALPVSPGGSAMLLARRMGGGYLPVTVERVSCVVGPGGDEAGTRHTAEVVVGMDGEALALLCLELWYKQQPTQMAAAGSELLVSHVPLLVLPNSCQAAAVQLQQHMDGMGGVQPRQACQAVVADPTCDAACCLLEDLGMWLTHHHSPTPVTVPDSVMSQLGGDLLQHAVLHGLGDVAELMVTTLQRGEGAAAGHSTWLQRATSGAPGALSAADGGGGGGPMPLLHAAIASGQPTMLEQVLRWGALYGGPAWAWPWELEYGEQGCTALHLAAAQPACPALLETITRTLPPGQVQAARSVWLYGRGGVGASPAEVFALACQGGSVGGLWSTADEPATMHPCCMERSATAGPLSASSGMETASDPMRSHQAAGTVGCSSAVPPCPTGASSAPPAEPPAPQSWLGSVIEVWTTRETDEYRTWTRRQMSTLVCSWAAAMTFIGLAACFRSFMAGCGLHEVPHITLHTLPYILMAAAASGNTWLGDWQAWMPTTHVFHSLAYLAKTYVPVGMAYAWASSSFNGAHMVYVVVLMAGLDQTPLPLAFVLTTFEAYCHSLAYASVGVPHPQRHALLVHACALAVSTLCRVWQLKAFRRWQAVQQSHKLAKAKSI